MTARRIGHFGPTVFRAPFGHLIRRSLRELFHILPRHREAHHGFEEPEAHRTNAGGPHFPAGAQFLFGAAGICGVIQSPKRDLAFTEWKGGAHCRAQERGGSAAFGGVDDRSARGHGVTDGGGGRSWTGLMHVASVDPLRIFEA